MLIYYNMPILSKDLIQLVKWPTVHLLAVCTDF